MRNVIWRWQNQSLVQADSHPMNVSPKICSLHYPVVNRCLVNGYSYRNTSSQKAVAFRASVGHNSPKLIMLPHADRPVCGNRLPPRSPLPMRVNHPAPSQVTTCAGTHVTGVNISPPERLETTPNSVSAPPLQRAVPAHFPCLNIYTAPYVKRAEHNGFRCRVPGECPSVIAA